MGAADPSIVLSSSRSVACCFISWRVRTNLDHSSALGLAMCCNRHNPTFQNSSTFLLVLGWNVDKKQTSWGVIFRSGRSFFPGRSIIQVLGHTNISMRTQWRSRDKRHLRHKISPLQHHRCKCVPGHLQHRCDDLSDAIGACSMPHFRPPPLTLWEPVNHTHTQACAHTIIVIYIYAITTKSFLEQNKVEYHRTW